MVSPASYAVIGHPLGHSMSPFIHQRLFALSGREATYGAMDIPPDSLDTTLTRLFGEMAGLNVTIPYKQSVIPHLSRLEGRAALYRSVNTIAVTGEETVGYNTDADGFLMALKAKNVSLSGEVALLGCGGVGRTFACEAALAGCRLVNAVRPSDLPAAEELRQYVLTLVPDAHVEVLSLEALESSKKEFSLLINATPVGMFPHTDASPVSEAVTAHTAAVFDAVYNPGQTRLLKMAASSGAVPIGGMPMLVWQAAAAHALWYDAVFDPADIDALVIDAQREMEHLFGECKS